MGKKHIIILILCFSVLLSCDNSKIEKGLEGHWSIDTIYYKNNDLQHCLIGNLLYLSLKEKSNLPRAKNYCKPMLINNFDKTADLKIIKSDLASEKFPYKIIFMTKNEIFNGTKNIIFHRDDHNRILKLEIFSDDLYLICRKGYFDYTEEINFVRELETISWPSRPK